MSIKPPILSAGLVVFHRPSKDVFLVRQHNGMYWGFPKGHLEEGETALEAAIRETSEEAGLQTKVIFEFSHSISYTISVQHERDGNIQVQRMKQVTFFPAITDSRNYAIDEHEIAEAGWYTVEEAHALIQFSELTTLLDAIIQWLDDQPYCNVE